MDLIGDMVWCVFLSQIGSRCRCMFRPQWPAQGRFNINHLYVALVSLGIPINSLTYLLASVFLHVPVVSLRALSFRVYVLCLLLKDMWGLAVLRLLEPLPFYIHESQMKFFVTSAKRSDEFEKWKFVINCFYPKFMFKPTSLHAEFIR